MLLYFKTFSVQLSKYEWYVSVRIRDSVHVETVNLGLVTVQPETMIKESNDQRIQ